MTSVDPLRPPPPDGFPGFFRESYRPLVKVLRYLGADEQEAEDAVAEAMVEVLRRWNTIKKPEKYARLTAVRMFVRHRARGRQLRDRLVERGLADPDPAGESAEREDQAWVIDLLAALPPMQARVMALLVDGYSTAEIAQCLDKTPAAVRKDIERARRQLRRQLAPDRPDQADTAHHRPLEGRNHESR